MTVVAPDAGTIEHLEPGDGITCDVRSALTNEPACAQPGAWWVVCRRCGERVALCVVHHVQLRLILARHPLALVACPSCKAVSLALLWRFLLLLVPIGGRG